MTKRRWREGVGLTALNVFFIALCFLTLIPILYALSVSFNGSNSLLSSDFSFIPRNFTLKNYREVLFGENITLWFRNTIFLAVVTVFLSLLVAVPAAYCFSRRRFPGRKAILRCLVLLNSFPAILSMFAIYRLLRPMGLVNTRLGLILVYTGTMAVFSLWNTKGYFDTIPTEIEDAATIDGAGPIRNFTQIMMPMCKPVLTAITVFTFMGSWNDFNGPLIYLYDANKYTLSLGLSFFKGLYTSKWNLLMAATVLVMLPVLVLFFIAQDYIIDGISISSGTKG